MLHHIDRSKVAISHSFEMCRNVNNVFTLRRLLIGYRQFLFPIGTWILVRFFFAFCGSSWALRNSGGLSFTSCAVIEQRSYTLFRCVSVFLSTALWQPTRSVPCMWACIKIWHATQHKWCSFRTACSFSLVIWCYCLTGYYQQISTLSPTFC